MAATQVSVRVVDGDTLVEDSVRRPVRLTPDGFAGAVYAGAVYPLHQDNRIDLGDPSWEIEDCNRFLFAGAPIPYRPEAGNEGASGGGGLDVTWHLESNRYGHYVVFNASEHVAGAVVDALERSGIGVQRWDVSHRVADDGRFYDWFARLKFKGPREEAKVLVAAVLAPAPGSLPVEIERSPDELRIEELEQQVETLLDRVLELRSELSESRADAEQLKLRAERAETRESQLAEDLDRAAEHQKSLHEQLAALRTAEPGLNKALLVKQDETEEMLEFVLAENASLQQEVSQLAAQGDADNRHIRGLQASVEDLSSRLAEMSSQEGERRRAVSARRGPLPGAGGFIKVAFARLEFVLDGIEVLANVDSPAAMMRALAQIDRGENIGKDLEGLRGWREVSKLATGIAGSEDLGRIYYKPDGDRVLVSVHVKQDDKEQRRFVERLRAL